MAISFCAKRIKILKSYSFNKLTARNNGFIILLPEIGEDLPEKDPLIKADGFPEFNTFSVERAMAAVGKETTTYEQELLHVRLHTTWNITKALYFGNQSLMPTQYYESIHTTMAKANSMPHMSVPLYKAWKKALENPDSNLTPAQQKIIEKHALEGRLNGLDLERKKRDRFTYSNIKINQKRNDFAQCIKFATKMFRTTIDNPHIFKEFPEEFLKFTAVNPNEYEKVSRGAQRGENTLRTSSTLEDIRDHKMEQAKLLGYKSFSHMSMETKMAGSLENIYRVMDNLLEIARPAQEKEFSELTNFAKDRGFTGELMAWDIDYWSRKYAKSVYNFNEEATRDYFPLPQVLKGLFQLIEDLFDVRIVEAPIKPDVWHADVRFFEVYDLAAQSPEPVAHFYLDPYERGRKMVAAKTASWAVPIQPRSLVAEKKPLVALIFNFKPPVGDNPSLLTFQDVTYLFKQVGHALQHLLTKVDYSMVGGTNSVQWDAVEVNSNVFGNWLYEPEVLNSICRHHKTGESMPADQLESIHQMRRHMAGYKLCKELYFGRLDLVLHEVPDFWVPIVAKLYKQHFVFPLDKMDSHLTSWSAIFSENMGAAYYSYLWAEMLAADVYSAFQEIPAGDKDLRKQTGARFRETYLSLGGSVHASQVFRQFRGRDPNYEALLRNVGLKDNEVDD
ncbi:Similar to CYOP: Probable cytosolic oligopeptidase A (Arabidopsis thaliana) [Cotesia congregata]|uniref:Similar to CYOP: Probable cytosolic oligopeptidase A (Arabidopsis thaliana) n=1 Tax=Cotesia congregata TaxID=51543 RepID=A0A8J2HFS4_COTCN|nr:Similar to CYOP: Probable cytosolic oligopeptidase A (Arabidopsis thaliana) [Cotesia congregata]